MNILLSTDNNYAMPTGVLMTSIGENNSCSINYYVIVDERFSNENRESLMRIAERYSNTISFYTITPEETKDFPVKKDYQPSHITKAAYYRLFVADILPSDMDKILYLDCDMVVRHSIEELWSWDISEYAIGVVRDCDEFSESKDNRLPYPMQEGYFNSGMLLINLDYWRKNKCYDMFEDFARKHSEILIYHDQDILNATLWDKKKWLPLTYNFQSSFIHKAEYRNNYERIEDEINATKYDPTIIHYVANTKPWKIDCPMGYRVAWRYYWKKTEWSKQGLMGDNPKTLKECIKNFLFRNELYFPKARYEKIILKK